MEETRQDLRTSDHADHPLQWRAGDTCLLCLMNVIQGHKGWLTVHRRYALSFFVKSLSLDPAVTLSQKQLLAHQNLVELLQRNREVSAKVVIGLLDSLNSNDVVDLVIEAIYRLYHNLRDEVLLDSVLTHCLQTLNDNILKQIDKWPAYLGLMQRFARLNPAAVGRKVAQYRALQKEMTEHISKFPDLVALHTVALLDLIMRNNQLWIHPKTKLKFLSELGILLKRSDCQRLQGTVLNLFQITLARDEPEGGSPGCGRDQIHLVVVDAVKQVILRSPPELQMTALEVLEILLWKQSQAEDGMALTELVLGQDMVELIYEVLYSNHHVPLLECALRCLHQLSRCSHFFQNRYLILGLEPVLRVTPYLLENNGNRLVVASAVQLLSDMLIKYQGEESLLALMSPQNAFHVATTVAVNALQSSSFHLQISGAHLIAALLNGKHMGLPLPMPIISHLIESAHQYLNIDSDKFQMETEVRSHQVTALVRILSSAVHLAAEYADQPAALLETYAASAAHPVAAAGETFARFNDFVISQIDRLLTPLLRRQAEEISSGFDWPLLLRMLIHLAGTSQAGGVFLDESLRKKKLLQLCFQLRSISQPIKEAADQVLTWFLNRVLLEAAPLPSSPFVSLKDVIRQIPAGMEELVSWLAHNQEAAFASKTAAFMIIYHLELGSQSETERLMMPQHAAEMLSSVAQLLVAMSPAGLDNASLLQSLWLLIAKYDGQEPRRASKALIHLIKWLQPNKSQLGPWIRQIYTHDACILRWTFSMQDSSAHLGPSIIRLWVERQKDPDAWRYLVELSADRNDDALFSSLLDLILDDDDDVVSCQMATVLEQIAHSSRNLCARVAKLVKCNVPRLLRWTDVPSTASKNHDRLVGALRLLCRLSSGGQESFSAWADPAMVAAIVSLLPRTAEHFHAQQDNLLRPTVTAMELWCWGCRYLSALIAAVGNGDSARALVDIITDNRPFLIYLNRLMDHDELPTWKDATRLVAALAAFHRPNYSDVAQVAGSIRVSTTKLAKKLTLGVTGTSQTPLESLLQLFICLLRGDFQNGFLVDPKLNQHIALDLPPPPPPTPPTPPTTTSGASTINRHLQPQRARPLCGEFEDVLEHLWITLLNWTLRVEPSAVSSLIECLAELMRFCSGRMSPAKLGRLMIQPWNYLALVYAIDPQWNDQKKTACPAVVAAARLLVAFDQSAQQRTGKHPWALQLERALSRHSRPCVGQRPSVNQTTADSDLEADIDGGKNADATQIPGQKNVKQVRQTVVELHDAVH